MTAKSPILPGSTLGVLGSGQLGRMFAIAARRLGYRVCVYSPDFDTPTGQVADEEIQASYDDLDRLAQFAQAVDVVTFEFENVPAHATEALAQHVPVRPDGKILHTIQNRFREKTFLSSIGVPVTPFAAIENLEQLQTALAKLGTPAILKTANWGYDGKGQRRINDPSEAASAWSACGEQLSVLEAFVDFECELSVVVARGLDGQMTTYAPFGNDHQNHILDVTLSPAPISAAVSQQAQELARTVAAELGLVGVLCVEYFLTRDQQLLINELAPRPHNSGHLTIDSHVTCQFEQQVRTICGLPLGSTEMLRPAAMANLLGDLWEGGEPDWMAACSFPQIKLHLYGKAEPRPGRKMGHLTALAGDVQTAADLVRQARAALTSR